MGAVGEPGPQRGDCGGGQQTAATARGLGQLGDGEPGDLAQPGPGEQGRVLPGDLGDHLVRHPVEDGDEGGVVLLGRTQQIPGHGVGVPRRGGHHHPDVGGADEFRGEHAVPYDEGVDVGRVQQRETARQADGGLDPQGSLLVVPAGGTEVVQAVRVPGLTRRQPDPGQLRQHPHPGEPVVVVRVADEHRCPGRRTQHTGLADPAPHERVHQRGLARAGRATDHREQRSLGILESWKQIVVELREQLDSGLPGPFGPWKREWKTHGGDTVAQGGKCVDELRPYVHGHHMRRMPNFGAFLKRIGTSARRFHPGDRRDEWGAGITSAQHPARETSKAVHESHLPAIIGSLHRTSTSCHAGEATGSRRSEPYPCPGKVRTGQDRPRPQGPRPPPAPVAQWIEQAPSKRLAAGSSPAGGTQLARHQALPREGLFCRSSHGSEGGVANA